MVTKIRERLNGSMKLVPIYALLIAYVVGAIWWASELTAKTKIYDQHLVEVRATMDDYNRMKTNMEVNFAVLKAQNEQMIKKLDQIELTLKSRR